MYRGVIAILFFLAATSVGDKHPVRASRSPRPLPFLYDLYTFRGEDPGGTAVVAAFAVPAGRLEREREDWAVRYRFTVSLVLADTVLGSLSRTTDSVFVRLPRSVGSEHLLSTHIEVEAPPSGNTLQRVIMIDATTPGIGQLYTSPFPIPDYTGSHLMLSDIALGLPEATTGWSRGDNTLALLPTGQIPGRAFDVYYEVYNLPAGNPYATRMTIEHIDDKDDPVSLQFLAESSADENDTMAELRRVETSLSEGQYRLTVTVTNQATGEAATRSRSLLVGDWGPGVTLVRAHRRNSHSAVRGSNARSLRR